MKIFLLKYSNIIVYIASIASIGGLIVTISSNKNAVIIALFFFCLTLTIIFIYTLMVLAKYNNIEYPEKYRVISNYTKYETNDGQNIIFESFRVIQAKCPILNGIDYHFKWSGSKMPKITSNLQEVEKIVDSPEDYYDFAQLKFKKSLLFNDTCIVHLFCEMDDVDNKSQPFVENKVAIPLDFIHYRIILRHKDSNFKKNAIISRKKIDAQMSSQYKNIGSIPFDVNSKSYEYQLLTPETGYYYRIEWEK